MEDLLEEFDPLSISRASTLPNGPPSIHHPTTAIRRDIPSRVQPHSSVRISTQSEPIFSSNSSKVNIQGDFPSGSSRTKVILAPTTSLSSDDPLGIVPAGPTDRSDHAASNPSLAPSAQGDHPFVSPAQGGLFSEAQRRSRLRQEALQRHLAHEPFRSSSPTTSACPVSKAPLITLANFDQGLIISSFSTNPIPSSVAQSSQQSFQAGNQSTTTSPIQIPTQLFQNQVTKLKNRNAKSDSSSNPSSHSTSPPNPTLAHPTQVDHQKLRAALEEQNFQDFFDPSSLTATKPGVVTPGIPHESAFDPSNAHSKSQRAGFSKEFDDLSRAPVSGRSTPSFFDGPEGRPRAIKFHGIQQDSRSMIMDEELAEGIRWHLPPRLKISSNWKLEYSLDHHGTSLTTLYDRVNDSASGSISKSTASHENEGCILLVQDSNQNRFGAYVNQPFKVSKEYYGSGECFLWKASLFEPGDFRIGVTVKAFHWTGLNDYMVLSDHDFLSVGGGDGKFGLWIDSNLDKGSTTSCPAFNNEILCGTGESSTTQHPEARSFDVWGIECWKILI